VEQTGVIDRLAWTVSEDVRMKAGTWWFRRALHLVRMGVTPAEAGKWLPDGEYGEMAARCTYGSPAVDGLLHLMKVRPSISGVINAVCQLTGALGILGWLLGLPIAGDAMSAVFGALNTTGGWAATTVVMSAWSASQLYDIAGVLGNLFKTVTAGNTPTNPGGWLAALYDVLGVRLRA